MAKEKIKDFNSLDPDASPDYTDYKGGKNPKYTDELGESFLDENAVLNRANEIQENLMGIDESIREQVGLEKVNAYGTNYATNSEMWQDLGLEPSQWFKNVGWKVLDQSISRHYASFPLANLYPLKKVRLGKLLKNYSDNLPADELAAYGEYGSVEKYYELLSPDGTLITEEAWHVWKNIHKGLIVPSVALNDITFATSLYLALVEAIDFNIGIPMARVFYQINLLRTQDPEHFKNGYDWSEITPDFIVEGTDAYDNLTQWKDFFVGLGQTSRRNQPTAWIPKGLPIPQEFALDMSQYVLLVPNNFMNVINVQMKSGRFNEEYLNVFPKMLALDYEKAFGEYIGATNMGTRFENADMRLVPVGKHFNIEMFKGEKRTELAYMAYVINVFQRMGHMWDKSWPLFKLKNIVKPIENGDGGVQKVEITNQPDISKLATEETLKKVETNTQPAPTE